MLDDRIESVVFRVEEFKSQLERMHQSLTSAFGETEELHKQMPLLKELFARIEQVEVSTSVHTHGGGRTRSYICWKLFSN